jgi:uracil-DNA glycosylase
MIVLDAPTQQDALDTLHAEIRDCRRCVAAGWLTDANPVFMGRVGQRLMILGQAPGRRGHLAERPWSGASGKTLVGWLSQAGFPDGTLWEHFYLTSVTKCFPGPGGSGNGDRMPSGTEVALCRGHLDREIALVRPEIVVTLGRLAANALLSRRPLEALVGELWPASRAGHDMLVAPLPHPSGVSRWLNVPENRERVAAALTRFGEACRIRGLP